MCFGSKIKDKEQSLLFYNNRDS